MSPESAARDQPKLFGDTCSSSMFKDLCRVIYTCEILEMTLSSSPQCLFGTGRSGQVGLKGTAVTGNG